jgi:hypothetical protein
MASPMPTECGLKVNCYVDQAIAGLTQIHADIDYWNTVSFWSVVLAGFFGILATVMIALQGDNNKVWTRPIGIVSTSLVTGITALTTSLHVPDTIDKLIELYIQTGNRVNQFEYDARDKSDYDLNEITKKYIDDYNKLRGEMLLIKGSAGRLNIGPPPTSLPPLPSNASPTQK